MKNNIPPSIQSKIGKDLHNKKNHPIEIIKRKIYSYFDETFEKFDNLSPIVKIKNNFDDLLIPENHPSRSMSDTYYVDEEKILRTHTSAHQTELLIGGKNRFLVCGQVFRKDEINFSHYPTFFQMEGVCVVDDDKDAETELKNILNGLINALFPNCEYRFKNDYFPFTDPSFEVEVFFNGDWLEILGCGIIHKTIMKNCGLDGKSAWAFGLGLDRIALILFGINDIRFLWSEDERFIKQFESGEIVEFKPYSKYPEVIRDMAFWIHDDFCDNKFYEIIREVGGDLIENVSLIDEFVNPKNGKTSKCFRITYHSNDKTFTSDEINDIELEIKDCVSDEFMIEFR